MGQNWDKYSICAVNLHPWLSLWTVLWCYPLPNVNGGWVLMSCLCYAPWQQSLSVSTSKHSQPCVESYVSLWTHIILFTFFSHTHTPCLLSPHFLYFITNLSPPICVFPLLFLTQTLVHMQAHTIFSLWRHTGILISYIYPAQPNCHSNRVKVIGRALNVYSLMTNLLTQTV